MSLRLLTPTVLVEVSVQPDLSSSTTAESVVEEAPIPDTPPTAQPNPAFEPQAPAQLASQSIFAGLHGPSALDFDDWDDQLVVPPAHAQAEPAPARVTFVPPHDSCFDSSSDDEMPLQDIQFVSLQGCAECTRARRRG